MTTPFDARMLDMGNALLTKVPTTLDVGTIDSPEGQLAVLTWRSGSTTFTTFAKAPELKVWLDLQNGLYSSLSSSGLIVARGGLPPVKP